MILYIYTYTYTHRYRDNKFHTNCDAHPNTDDSSASSGSWWSPFLGRGQAVI